MRNMAMGQEKEPSQPNGPKVGGKQPPFMSHSAKPKRMMKGTAIRKKMY